ncbi:TonB-linked outer membrane protein, SusC/RagA family [Catalinimonas alkaloidigena]|uniref:TonB-linked outer membrane protein, SusC/RagA family n=1 Tax=Catalinimonas alkaloidigena TaxID=1075417 RepID=A0A1G9HK55_9BACT|nr:TonB-dependent receptor [Catalinimonas alkaloidigena]SDL13252.1 TonB-linked outer membrane protein, SusC/RagA family [Catalinimonas alkaloidigena]
MKKVIYHAICLALAATPVCAGKAQSLALATARQQGEAARAAKRELTQVLQEIEDFYQVEFLYRMDAVEQKKVVLPELKSRSLPQVMSEVMQEAGLSYRKLDDTHYALYATLPPQGHLPHRAGQIVPSMRQLQVQTLAPRRLAPTALAVSGRITDVDGEGIPGVNVLEKGTTNGTITDVEGRYVLNVAETATLVFSAVGYLTQEVAVASRSTLDLTMEEDVKALEEVVVVGYGTQEKAEVTSSIASVKSREFIKAPVKNAGQLLQGKVAGLTVASSSGDPTSGVAVLLRGNTTILGANTSPLVLIDGIPGDLNTVAPEDIESIDVLKDGSAAAIYGVRGNNGVILITTKRFQEGGGEINTVEYSTQLSTQRIARRLNMLTADDYRQQIASGIRDASWDNGHSTDWFEETTQKPFSQVHNLTFRGGTSKTNYLLNFNYRGFNGIIKKSDNETFNGRIDVVHQMFKDKLTLNLGIIGRQNTYTTTGDGFSFNGWTYRQMMIQNPTSPTRNEDGNWFQEGIFDYDNPLARLYESDGRNKTQYTRYNARINFTPFNGLRLNANMAYDKYNQSRGYAETKRHVSTTRDGRNGYASVGADENIYRFLELIAEYRKNFGDHKFTALAGYGYQESEWLNMWMQNYDFATDAFGYANIGAGKALTEGKAAQGSSRGTNNLISFFGRSTYSFREKYLLMASVRHEAASQLYGTKKPWGTFPAVSVGWRVNEEAFLRGLSSLNNLKLRAGYGVTGNPPSDAFLGVATLSYADYFLVNGNWIRSLVPSQNPNPNLRWEEKKEFNVGLDYGLLNDRIYGSIDYYVRRIDGLLYDYQVPSPPNIYTSTRVNVGIMENKGLEVNLSTVPFKTDHFTWTSQFLFSTNANKLVSLSNDLYKLESNYFTAGGTGVPIQTHTHIVEIGERIGNFHGYKVVDVTDDGYWIYETKSGERVPYNDFNRGFDDKQIIGNGIPKYHAGWNNTFRYKSFDLSVTMRGSFAYQIINFQRMYYENTGDDRYNRLKSAYDPIFGKAVLNKNVPLEFNSYYVEDGDFWKIDNITLGYNFDHLKLKAIRSARVYVSTLNTFIITRYKGIDPEVSWTGLDPGIDNRDKYPTTRTFTLGVNLNF